MRATQPVLIVAVGLKSRALQEIVKHVGSCGLWSLSPGTLPWCISLMALLALSGVIIHSSVTIRQT
jgi:hypothetical protein